jgi:hypothetical protein
MSAESPQPYDVFLSHSHRDSAIVEHLGAKLEDEVRFRVWLDKWVLVPGGDWQQEMAHGLEHAKTCVACIGQSTPKGWFREEIKKALNRHAKDPTFRVIPLILPGANPEIIDDFLELRTWVDFSAGLEDPYAFHCLISGILGKSPGRYSPQQITLSKGTVAIREQLQMVMSLRADKLIDHEIAIEYQRRLLDRMIGD